MWSASSMTVTWTSSSEQSPWAMRSSRRPGQATTTSTPRRSALTCGCWPTPPKTVRLVSPAARALFESTSILTEAELESRYHVRVERYVKDMLIEVDTLAQITDTLVLPAGYGYANALARGAAHAKEAGISKAPQAAMAERVGGMIEALEQARATLGQVIERAEADQARRLARPYFVQMKGRLRISGRAGGAPISGEGRGFLETYR